MKLASEKAAGLWLPIPRELEAILGRLEQLSLGPEFSVQREAALRRVLSRSTSRWARRLRLRH
ncbi:MAG: hypothetical protein U0231_03630 [Nitrospiraceae bacterium]